MDNFMRSQSSFSRLEGEKKIVYENSVLRLYKAVEGDRKYRIK